MRVGGHPAIRMRAMRRSDGPALVRLFDDPAVTRMTSTFPLVFTAAFAEKLIDRHLGWDGVENVGWIVEADGAPAGSVSLERRAPQTYELAYAFGRDVWGRGLATAAARRALDHGRDALGARRAVAGRHADNPASGRVLEKLGFARTCETAMEVSRARGGLVQVVWHALDLRREAP